MDESCTVIGRDGSGTIVSSWTGEDHLEDLPLPKTTPLVTEPLLYVLTCDDTSLQEVSTALIVTSVPSVEEF